MNKIITISREYGAGGHSIGTKVAEKLGIPFYDKDIVKVTAQESGYDVDLVMKEQEDRTDSFLRGISSAASSYFHDSQDAIHEIQRSVILKMVQQGPCVILGRCADVIMKEAGIDSLNVFIHADDVHRAVHVSEMTGSKNATEIQKMIAKKDGSRHKYYAHYTGKKWGDSTNYDMTLNSGVLGYDLCVDIIVQAAMAENE